MPNARTRANVTKAVETVESPADRFVRLAEQRMPKVLKGIALLGNLGSSQYEYTPEQRDQLLGTLQSAVLELEGKLKREKSTASYSFKFTV